VGASSDAEFDEFVRAAWPRLRWTAYLLVGDAHLAEDLAQTALVKTYAAWSRVRRDDALAYARRVLVNANIDRLRRRRLTEVALPEGDGGVPAERVPEGSDPVADRDALVRLLGGLTAQERRVVVLRYLYDLTEPMVAGELRISVGTVKSTTSRALAKLRVSRLPELTDPDPGPDPGTGPASPANPAAHATTAATATPTRK
jgi:RNA polymerase sigma-70 factor (sigma-E family)